MRSSKQGKGQFIQIILALPIFMMVAMFGIIGLFQIQEEFIIDNVHNATLEVADQNNVSSQYTSKIDEVKQNYLSIDIPYDLFFSLLLLTAFSSSLYFAATSPRLPTFSFLGYLVLGTMLLLFIMTFIDQFVTWYIDEFFYVLFDNFNENTPVLDWYFANMSKINVLWMVLLLLVNQVRLNMNTEGFTGGGDGLKKQD